MNCFETADLASSDEDEEKLIFLPRNICGVTCKLSHKMTNIFEIVLSLKEIAIIIGANEITPCPLCQYTVICFVR
jgi:hypothetical protein